MKFKMVCYSAKCCGQRVSAQGSTKFEDKFVRDCPDCGHAMVKESRAIGTKEKVKDTQKVSRPEADFGFRTVRKYFDQDL